MAQKIPRKCAARKIIPIPAQPDNNLLIAQADARVVLDEIDKIGCEPIEKFLFQALASNLKLIADYCADNRKTISELSIGDILSMLRPGKQLETEIERRLQHA